MHSHFKAQTQEVAPHDADILHVPCFTSHRFTHQAKQTPGTRMFTAVTNRPEVHKLRVFFTFHFGSSKGCVQPQSLVRISRCDVKIKSFLIKALRAFFQQHLGHPWSTPIKRSCHGNDLRKAGGMWSTTCIKATTIPSVMPC